ncbi:NUDIX hydrolase [Arthrobacter sp. ISL-30]|uniref:NUDIX hydrolase n=1 Tax=Arthrobacter sp. ISL-30 TaxID=2819109 RepID=UPI001BE57B96|nr:NUDIX hydrolase [Arthrobacter sp. ISL-30]MBT2512249.1 NUDIX hydrolase [Arthrobacter sp. ISL-30]
MNDSAGTGSIAKPRLAASVILLRDGAAGLEVFVQHRVSTMDFAAEMVVFPGGRVDEIDRRGWDYAEELLTSHAHAWRRSSLAGTQDAGMLIAAALREVFEEAGIQLEAGSLLPWANWITPPDQPKRFDTFFFLAVPDRDVEPQHLTTEASASLWMPVSDILEQEAAQTLKLMPPTFVLLGELAELGSVDAVLSLEREIIPVKAAAGALQEFLKRRR